MPRPQKLTGQSKRTSEDQESFDEMLPNIPLLCLGCSVLIVLDLQYNVRFWTQFEAWLALQRATASGLAQDMRPRYVVAYVQNASDDTKRQLFALLAGKSAQEVHDTLALDDVFVTNRKDKELQLPKVLAINRKVRAIWPELQAAGLIDMQPDALKRAIEKPLADEAVYMHISVQPAATVTNYTRNRLALAQQLDQLELALKREAGVWQECGARSLSLDDGNRDRLVDMLKQGCIHCLVWCANGIGWESDQLPASLSIEGLEDLCKSPLRPRVVVVCLRHGAEAAADRLRRAGVQRVIWLAADLLGSTSDLKLNALPQALMALHRGARPSAVTDELKNNLYNVHGECLCNPAEPIIPPSGPSASSTTDWLTVFKPRLLNDCNLDIDLSSRSCGQSLLACDQPKVDELRECLHQATCFDEGCRIAIEAPSPTASNLQRCQAVASEACIAHLHGKIYNFVWRVSNAEDLQRAITRLRSDRDLRALLWIDSTAAVMVGLQLDAFIDLLGDTHHVLLTCSEGSDQLINALGCDQELLLGEISAGGARAGDLHEEMTLYASDARADGTIKAHCLLDLYEPKTLVAVIESLIDVEQSVAAIYRGDEGECVIRVWICDVARLHSLRDTILIGDFDQKLTNALKGTPSKLDVPLNRLSIVVDRSHFAERYEASILQLEELTPHQEQKLTECEAAGDDVDIHVMAPAGAGKTFVALHLLLRTLRGKDARVLFVARRPALCFFVAKWLAR